MRGDETLWRAMQDARRALLGEQGRSVVRGVGGIGRRTLLQAIAAAAVARGTSVSAAPLPPARNVAIVGGGIAGLTALHHLASAGVEARLYEARNRLGGRMFTQRASDGQLFEAGGQLVNTDHADMHALAKAFGIPLIDRKPGPHRGVVVIDGAVVRQDDLARLLRPLAARIMRDWQAIDVDSRAAAVIDRVSVAAYLDQHAALIPDPRVRRLIETSIRTEYGAEPQAASALQLILNLPTVRGEQVEVLAGSDERYTIAGGSGRLANAIAERHRARIETGKRLRSIQDIGGRVRLAFLDGTMADADAVIVAVPAPILRQIDFAVPLSPRWRAFIAQAELGFNEKVQVAAAATPWRDVLGGGGELWDAGAPYALGWDGTVLGVEGKPVWTWYLGGAQVTAARAVPSGQLMPRYALASEPAVPGIVQAVRGGVARRSNWADDALTLGAYTNSRPGQLTRFGPLFWVEADDPAQRQQAISGRVLFAGEHVSDAWVGFMNGGAQTGRLAAQAVIAAHGRFRSA